ncbi:hypothetical protein GCM10025873_05020 [Demequina sediminis]|uniref:NADH-quinone oxidoreductase subunit K n=1 Tax=Demequina sediminis TaxID=1930058 RepID=UPI0025738D6D|nr:NADH-quinone oxidoreductase subunit K [Demequina sediminis]BDZ60711.1 hypothetical protein GCM10025873_05020 [Demequina sediminis]
MTVALTAGLLVAGAVYLLLKREMLRVILGFVLLGHAANLIIMAAGGTSRREAPSAARKTSRGSPTPSRRPSCSPRSSSRSRSRS